MAKLSTGQFQLMEIQKNPFEDFELWDRSELSDLIPKTKTHWDLSQN